MSAEVAAHAMDSPRSREPWFPMVVIALGQALLSFNAAALPISMGDLVESFQTPPTTVGTAIVLHALGVSAFILLGAKLGRRFGSRLFFQVSSLVFLVAMLLMAASPGVSVMLGAQSLAGLSGAAMVPTLVVLITDHYRGTQQGQALGWLGSARAMAGALAFLLIGALERFFSWRVAFALLVVHAAVIFVLSFRLKPSGGIPGTKFDLVGVVLSASAIIVGTLGVNALGEWGIWRARPAAPFAPLGVSPAVLMIVLAALLGAAFTAWTRRQVAGGAPALLAISIVEAPMERATLLAMFFVGVMEAAVNFSVPLYIQIVQGRDAFQTAVAMLPLKCAVFTTAILVVRLYRRVAPRQIATGAFLVIAAGASWLALVARNDWSKLPVMLGLILFGIGTGALVTLLFNVLVTAVNKDLAGDVGALRGVANNMSVSVGTALTGALVVGVLSVSVLRELAAAPAIPSVLREQVDRSNINFISNERLAESLRRTSATPAEISAALQINEAARLRALKYGFLAIGALSLLALIPARRLPGYRAPDEAGGASRIGRPA